MGKHGEIKERKGLKGWELKKIFPPYFSC